jgi:hypothetical protein
MRRTSSREDIQNSSAIHREFIRQSARVALIV